MDLSLVWKKEAATLYDFRPKSLIHSCTKILSKVLASILVSFLGSSMDHPQAAFLKRPLFLLHQKKAFLQDNILCANEIPNYS